MLAGIIESDAGAVAGISRSLHGILIASLQVYIPHTQKAAAHAYYVVDEALLVTMHSVHADRGAAVCIAANRGAISHAVWCDSCAGHRTASCATGVAASEAGGSPQAQDGQAHRPRGRGHRLWASACSPVSFPTLLAPRPDRSCMRFMVLAQCIVLNCWDADAGIYGCTQGPRSNFGRGAMRKECRFGLILTIVASTEVLRLRVACQWCYRKLLESCSTLRSPHQPLGSCACTRGQQCTGHLDVATDRQATHCFHSYV